MRTKHTIAYALPLAVLLFVGGCKNSAPSPATVQASNPTASAEDQLAYSDPPSLDVGLTVDQAYAAIPHRRTVWSALDSTATPEEKSYLHVIFALVDQAIALRVAAWQTYSNADFDSLDVDAQYDRLLDFANATHAPDSLIAYHQHIITAISSQRQFFHDWKSNRAQFPYAQHMQTHPAIQTASRASHDAYNELMRKFPSESAANKNAFFDYHCALDFL